MWHLRAWCGAVLLMWRAADMCIQARRLQSSQVLRQDPHGQVYSDGGPEGSMQNLTTDMQAQSPLPEIKTSPLADHTGSESTGHSVHNITGDMQAQESLPGSKPSSLLQSDMHSDAQHQTLSKLRAFWVNAKEQYPLLAKLQALLMESRVCWMFLLGFVLMLLVSLLSRFSDGKKKKTNKMPRFSDQPSVRSYDHVPEQPSKEKPAKADVQKPAKADVQPAKHPRNVSMDGVYEWSQTAEVTTVYIRLPELMLESNLDIKVSSGRLRAGPRGGSCLIKGDLFDKVDKESSCWQLKDKGRLEIYLKKVTPAEWPFVLHPCIAHVYQSNWVEEKKSTTR